MKKLFIFAVAFLYSINHGIALAGNDSGFNISGFVDSSYFMDDNADTSSFSLDQIEIDITKEIKDWASLRLDLQHLPSGGGNITADDAIEQGYLTLTPGGSVTFTFGKFNAPIGFELLDPADMYQFSHALVFDNGLPTNLTGLMASGAFSELLDYAVYVVNGWDNNPDNNKNKTFGGRIGITPTEGINLGLSAITGDDSAVTGENMTVFDIDGTITTLPNLTIGLEFNFGSEGLASTTGTDANWFGFLVMGHYDYSDWGGLTVRYDYFDDGDGARLGTADNVQQAFTASTTFVIADGFGALFEYRYDTSDKNVFTDSSGALSDNNSTFAFEMTYAF